MKKITLSLLLLIACMSAFSQEDSLYLKREFVYKGDTLKYRVLFPKNYDKTRHYPLVLFLHGAGERGNDNEKQLVHGSKMFINEQNREKYPAIVIFPQCPEDNYWVKIPSRNGNMIDFPEKPEISKPLFLVKKLLDMYKNQEAIDTKRVYVMGISMGGMGTFDLICRYPTYFAAAVPICGGVYEKRLKKVVKMPIRIFHGSDDDVISKEHSRNAYIELKADGSGNVEYVEFPGIKHDSWTKAFAYPDFLSWIFNKTK